MSKKRFGLAAGVARWLINAYWHLVALHDTVPAWLADHRHRRRYPELSEQDLRRARKSDTVFICGTGYSVLEITPDEWSAMARHDVLSFRDFPRQQFVKADFHVTGEIDDVQEYSEVIRKNPRYDHTLFLVQEGFSALMGNRFIGWRKLREGTPVFRYRRRGRGALVPFSRSFADGVVHGFGSVVGMVNIAYLLGWKRIVLVGIDLYDHRYFFMPPDQTRTVEKAGLTYASPFNQGDRIVEQIGMWRDLMRGEGIEVYAFNPRSLLTRRLPVFDRSALVADTQPENRSRLCQTP